MPERNLKTTPSLQKWRGVDQRVQPTIVKEGIITFARGLLFGSADNAERLPGKVLVFNLNTPVLQIQQFGRVALVQTLTTLQMCSVTDLFFSSKNLNYVSNGDANGVCYFLGTNLGTTVWANPHTAGRCQCVTSTPDAGANPNLLVNRAASNFNTTNVPASFIGIDLGINRLLRVDKYSLQNRLSFTTESIRNWKLQGCNFVAGNTEAAWNAATWTDLDTHTNDTTMPLVTSAWATFSVSTSLSFRFLRILQTGLNSGPPPSNYLCFGEFEFYGRLTY